MHYWTLLFPAALLVLVLFGTGGWHTPQGTDVQPSLLPPLSASARGPYPPDPPDVLFLFPQALPASSLDPSSSPAQVIQQASAFSQGGSLYARADLDAAYVNHLMGFLRYGEPILVTYRFRLYRLHPWLPGLRLSHAILKRRLRLRMITRRFEMLDVQTGRIQYTANPEDAKSFIGAPHYVFLGRGADRLSADHTYRLHVTLTIEHEGTLPLFRILDRWLRFGPSGAFDFQTIYTP